MTALHSRPVRPPEGRSGPTSLFRAPAERRILLLLVVLGLGVPAGISAALGSWGLPSLDDWSYRRVAAGFAEQGHLHYGGWVSMTFVGQAVWAWPFLRLLGPHGWVFATSTMILSAVGLGSAYWLARQLLARGPAAAAVLLLLAGPGMLLNTSTFMTDVPALGAELLSLALGIAGLRGRGRTRALLVPASLAVGSFGFAIREFDIVAPAAVLLCGALAARGRRRWPYAAAAVFLLGACGLIYGWTSGLPGMWKIGLGPPTWASLLRLVRAYFLVALGVLPALLLALRTRRVHRPGRGAVAGAAVLVLGLLADHGAGLWVGNNLEPQGPGGTLLLGGARPVLVGVALWHAVAVVSLLSGVVLAWFAAGSLPLSPRSPGRGEWDAPRRVFEVFTALVVAGFVVYVLLAPKIFDRYFWAPQFAGTVLLLAARPRPAGPRASRHRARGSGSPTRVLVGAACGLLGTLALILTVNSDSYDAARWRAGLYAVGRGVPAGSVDAGFEWVGAHATGPVDLALQALPRPSYEPWYARMEPGYRSCAVVSGSPDPDPGLRLMARRRYLMLGLAGPAYLYVYRVTAGSC